MMSSADDVIRHDDYIDVESDIDEDPDVARAMQQMRHNHENLMREKREMEQYCEAMEREAMQKDHTISTLKGHNETLSKEVRDARKVVVAIEQEADEVEVPARRRRALPERPQGGTGSRWGDEGSAAPSPPRRVRLGGRSPLLISGLGHGSSLEDGSDVDGSVGGGEYSGAESWGDAATVDSGLDRTLQNELAEACGAVDEEELIMLAQRFNAVKEQLDEARVQLADRATEQDALDHALNEQDRLQSLLENACEALQHEKSTNRKLQDELDEALGGDVTTRSRSGSFAQHRAATGDSAAADAASSLADELAAFSWETEKTDIVSELSQLKAKVGALETELAGARAENVDFEAKLAETNAERERWQGQVHQLETKLTKNDQDALERQAAHEMAQSTMKGDMKALQKQASELGIELEVARGVSKRLRDEIKGKIASASAKHDVDRDKFAAEVAKLEAELEQVRASKEEAASEISTLRQSSRESISDLKKQLATGTSDAQQKAKQGNREIADLKKQLAAKTADLSRVQDGVKDNDVERMELQKKLEKVTHHAQQMKTQRDQKAAAEKSAAASAEKLEERLKKMALDHIAIKTKLSSEEAAKGSARNAVDKIKAEKVSEKAQFDVDLQTARKAAADAEVAHLDVQKELRAKIAKLQLSCTENADKYSRAEEEAVRINTERLSLMNELSEAQSLHTSTMDAESKASEELAMLRASSKQMRDSLADIEVRMSEVHGRADSSGRELAATLTDLNRSMHDNSELTQKLNELVSGMQGKEDALREAAMAVAHEREQVASLASDLQDAQMELQSMSAMQQMSVVNFEQQSSAFERKTEEAEQAVAEASRLSGELEDAQRTISALSDKVREDNLNAKRAHEAYDALNSEVVQLKERCMAFETDASASHFEASARVEAESNLAELQQRCNDWEQEQAELLARGKDTDGRFARAKTELAHAKTAQDAQERECGRLMSLVEDAGRNIKDHVAAGEASAKEIERLRAALVHAETASRRAREWVEQTEASHEKARAKIIERADREIRRQRDVIAEAKSIGASLAEQLSALGGPINLVPVHAALERIHDKMSTLAKSRRHASNPTLSGMAGIPPLPPAADARGQEATLLLGWAQTLENTTAAIVDSVLAVGIPTPTPPAPPQNNDAGLASDSVARLLHAVKRFHSAEAVGQTLIAGGPQPSFPHQPPRPQQQQQQQQHYQHQQHNQQQQQPFGSRFNPAQMTMENIGEAPDQAMPDSLDSKALSMAQLSTEEYTELHRDWKRLKTKVQDLSTRLRSAKAAVAVGKFREETQRVYIRNRDRLVSRIILKPANKARTIRLLQMLQDTGV